MELVCISDTHGFMPTLPDGDVLIHTGDYARINSLKELSAFTEWFSSQPHKHKILIPGNHDWVFDDNLKATEAIVANKFHVLIDKGITIDGVNFYGTPAQPVFYNWAFNYEPYKLKTYYSAIPDNTDVLLTHCPPYGILDKVQRGSVGSGILASRVQEVRPKVHVFGHIHEGYGTIVQDETTFVNCSICDEHYRAVNKPIVIEI